MKFLAGLLLGSVAASTAAMAADPVRIGVTTILSGANADRGQSEQYGIELALAQINAAGGVLGRPVAAFYGDNAADPQTGLRATRRLIDQQHVPVLIGALATSVTHAIMPLVQEAKIPLVVEISAGQDFVDASGAGGNPYVFKTIPSDLDIARDLIGWLKTQGVAKVAIVADENPFNKMNAVSMARAASDAGIAVVADETVAKGTTDLAPLLQKLKGLAPDQLVTVLGPSTAAFFRAYEASGWPVAVSGRVDLAGAAKAVSAGFLAGGGLSKTTTITVFSAASPAPGVQEFIHSYTDKYGIAPTQRAFYAFEAAELVVDAIRRAGSDKSADIAAALKSSTMPSALGGTYKMDDHNHPHTPMEILTLREGKPAVVASVGG